MIHSPTRRRSIISGTPADSSMLYYTQISQNFQTNTGVIFVRAFGLRIPQALDARQLVQVTERRRISSRGPSFAASNGPSTGSTVHLPGMEEPDSG
ncbi:MAG: hypothetical protein HY043_14125 [Verrucomicrobia bacterium]|nr:hypothetical protein [Verrucomicrobiota bacterium]